MGGKGIRVFERADAGYADCKTHEPLTDELLASLSASDHIVQEGLMQHPLMNAIYPTAINTFRLVTECDGQGDAHVLLALLRMGSGGGHIDNASSGGLYIRVDPQTGTLGDLALREDHTQYATHPDTGFHFSGYQVPVWDELKAVACATALKYRELRYVSWDVAYTADGPAIIEGNNGPSIEILQDHYGGLRELFGIDDPRSLWLRKDYTLRNT